MCATSPSFGGAGSHIHYSSHIALGLWTGETFIDEVITDLFPSIETVIILSVKNISQNRAFDVCMVIFFYLIQHR